MSRLSVLSVAVVRKVEFSSSLVRRACLRALGRDVQTLQDFLGTSAQILVRYGLKLNLHTLTKLGPGAAV